MTDDQVCALPEALGNLSTEASLRTGAEKLLNALGYNSQRTADVGSVEDFQERYAPSNRLTEKQRKLFESWNAVEIVFQFTTTEIATQSSLFETLNFDVGRMESFLFLTVDMVKEVYTRTYLADTTRIVNSFFKMPVILLYRHGSTLTLAAIHRRAHKRDDGQDVLERVTLVK
ncbi:MAG: hypothetical protein OXK72_06505, partial [Gammaproteobacteria bacterium]|nr:hypothetical protein [Gammaproteobacteria bacterium]